MKIVLMSREPKNYSSTRLREVMAERGHECVILDPLKCYMNINSEKARVHYKGEVIDGVQAVIPRIGSSVTYYATTVLRQFEGLGAFALNQAVAISRSRDKLRSLQLLSRKNVGMPVTGFANKHTDVKDLISMVGGAPLVVKLLEGTQGIGVVLAESQNVAESIIEAFMGLNAQIIVQEFIKEADGADIRCFVIGDKVVAAMKRQGAEGEFRSNLHRGGSSEVVKLSPTERKTAILAAKVMGLNVAGVDLLRSSRGPLVMEVNSSPGLEGIETSTNIDVAGKIIDFIEQEVAKGKRTREKG